MSLDCSAVFTTEFVCITFYIVTYLTEGNNRIRDTVAPFLLTVTTGLYGYEANNGMRGYVATGESAPEVSRRQLVFGSRRDQYSKRAYISESSKWDVSAGQFRQWDPWSYQCHSTHCNCNICSCESPERINPVSNPNPRRVISHTIHPWYVTIW
jgi:hypothetical protein